MKKFKLFKMLAVLIVLITSVPQMWAYWIVRPKVYYYNSGGWEPGILLLGHNAASQGFNFVEVDNTQLWYVHPDIDWHDLSEANFGIAGNGLADWDYRSEKFSDRWYYLTSNYDEHTGSYYNLQWDNNVYKFIKYIDGAWTINSGNGAVPTHIAYLRVKYDERDGEGYGSVISGYTQWTHGVTFDFTGTCWAGEDGKTQQTTLEGLTHNYWNDSGEKWGYADIPYSGEVTFVLTGIDTGFELEGWAFDEDATSATHTPADPTDVTFNVIANTSYVAMIRRKQYTITLNDNGGSGGSGTKTLVYDKSTNMTSNVTVPTKSGYAFQGYYTSNDGTGSMVINSSGVWQKNVTNYTGTDDSDDPKWVRDGGVILYAKWTQDITLDREGGTTGSTAVTATYNSTTLGSFTNPERTGYTFGGYYSGNDGTNQLIINTSKALQANKTDGIAYTGDGGIWIHAGATTLYAKWTANEYAVTFDKESGTGGDASVTATYDADMPSAAMPTRSGYNFRGYWDGDDGTGTQYYDDEGSSVRTWDKASATTLHAKWEPKALTFNASTDGNWNTAGNWTDGFKPTIDHDITISAPVTVNTNAAVAKSIAFSGTGKITIPSDGVLEVAGTIDNTDASNIVINTTSSSQGALIYDISTPVAATVNMTMNNASSGFQLIASPTGGASVASDFFGEGVYTYAWVEGKGWERRGYYETFVGEAILVHGQTSCNFSGYLSTTCGGSLAYTDKPTLASAQGVNMLVNPLSAPIKVSAMTLTNSADNYVSVWDNGVWAQYSTASGENVVPAFNGYAVIASSSGSVSFTYDTAVRGASTKNAALKAPKQNTSEEQDHITISVTTNGRKVDLPLYEDAMRFTERIDKGYEAIYLEGDGRFGQLYAHADREMSILATPNLEGTVLGFTPGDAESYTITFEGDGKGYYLNDAVTGESTLIDEANTYVFTSDESTNDTRFVVSKMPMKPTGVDEVADGSKARKQMIDGTLYIIRDGRIYDAQGALVK